MVEVIIKKKYLKFLNGNHIKEISGIVFKHMNISPIPNLTILFTENKEIQSLNKKYRLVDEPTDVLSFSNDFTDPGTGEQYLGDIVISIPYAQAQAKKRGHSLIQELELLTIHGILHILGFDHDSAESQDEMWNHQRKLLQSINNPIQLFL